VGLAASVAAREMEADVALAARSDVRVLISGEHGVGKGALARIIHARSRRALLPFVPVRCSGLEERHLRAHLFGGAPPASSDGRAGALDRAAGGTLFLAGIGDAGPGTQQQLLECIGA